MALTTKYLTWRDFDRLWELFTAMRLEERQGLPARDDFDDPEVRARVRNTMERQLLDRQLTVLAVFHDELMVGVIGASAGALLGAWRKDPVYVAFLYTLPEYRDEARATAILIRAGMKDLRQVGCTRVQMCVGVDNGPHLLRVQSMGFEPRTIVYERAL